MKLTLSKRCQNLVQSEIRSMSLECEKVKGINLSQGVCDLKTPSILIRQAEKALREGLNYYTRYDGLYELREAIAKKMERDNKIKVDPEKNVIISAGATGALYCACLALLNEGDEVILFEPYYGYHLNTLLAVGAKPLFVRLHLPNWQFSISEIEKKISPKTKAILINTPANPSGKVFLKEELKEIAALALKYNLFLFTDEIYEYFVYDSFEHISIGSFPEVADRTITISGYSKTFSITGWRIGYVVCHEKWAKMIGYMNDLVYVCAPYPLQFAVAKGINALKKSFYQNIRLIYQKKRDKICLALKEAGLSPIIPYGAYYVLADVSDLPGKNSKDKAMYLLKKTGIATVPGSAFYHDSSGENLVRFCFAKEDSELNEAINRLKKLKY